MRVKLCTWCAALRGKRTDRGGGCVPANEQAFTEKVHAAQAETTAARTEISRLQTTIAQLQADLRHKTAEFDSERTALQTQTREVKQQMVELRRQHQESVNSYEEILAASRREVDNVHADSSSQVPAML